MTDALCSSQDTTSSLPSINDRTCQALRDTCLVCALEFTVEETVDVRAKIECEAVALECAYGPLAGCLEADGLGVTVVALFPVILVRLWPYRKKVVWIKEKRQEGGDGVLP